MIAGTTATTPVYPPTTEFAVARLNADGSLDTQFGTDGWATAAFPEFQGQPSAVQANAMAIEPGGQIVVAGMTGTEGLYGQPNAFAVARFNPDGTLDSSFGTGGEVINALGQDPNQVTDSDVAYAVVIQPDGKIVLGGEQVVNFNSSPDFALLRLNTDGSPDSSFGDDGVVLTAIPDNSYTSSISGLALQADGKIVAVGTNFIETSNNDFYSAIVLARYNPDGSLDSSFGQGGLVVNDNPTGADGGSAVTVQPGTGKIVVAGYSTSPFDPQYTYISNYEIDRYNPDGSVDTSFGTDGEVVTEIVGSRYNVATTAATLPDGKIVVAGTTDLVSPSNPSVPLDIGLTEYNPDGSLDTAFGNDGRVITTIANAVGFVQVNGVAVQPDGKIVVAGWVNAPTPFTDDFLLVRYNPDGSLDTTFGQGGVVEISGGEGNAVAIQPDGEIVEVGVVEGGILGIIRVNPDGSLDTSFGTGGEIVNSALTGGTSVVIQPNGEILVGGGTPGSLGGIALARYNPDGTLDDSFGTGGVVTTNTETFGVAAIALQPNGQIVAVGSTLNTGDSDYGTIFLVARFNADGSLDSSFGSGGIVTTQLPNTAPSSETPILDTATSVLIEADGKIVVGGQVQYQYTSPIVPAGLPYVALVRYNASGTLDPTFGTGGIAVTNLTMSFNNEPVSLLSQPDGKIVAAYAAGINPVGGSDFGVARFLGLDLNITAPILGVVGRNVTFTGSFDDETTADTSGVTWKFGDGTSLTFTSAAAPGALTPTHVYTKFGIYDVTLTIDFASGGTATTNSLIIILPPLFDRGFGASNESSDASGFDGAIAALTDDLDADPSLLELATDIAHKSKPGGNTGGIVTKSG